MKASIFCLPSVGSRAEIEAGMAATRPELYQRMLKELTELVKLADDLGYALVGTVDTVTRALEANMKRQPVDWLFCYTYNALVPHSKLMKSTEALWTKVLPKFM
jgi:hypothetical protein